MLENLQIYSVKRPRPFLGILRARMPLVIKEGLGVSEVRFSKGLKTLREE
jgi:hypothetical protein